VVWASALVQFTFDALYSPLRQSMIPLIVRTQDLQIVTTLVIPTSLPLSEFAMKYSNIFIIV
jgi:hypothetical protein